MYIIFIESGDGQTLRPARNNLLCVCIGADSGDSADSTFSVTDCHRSLKWFTFFIFNLCLFYFINILKI